MPKFNHPTLTREQIFDEIRQLHKTHTLIEIGKMLNIPKGTVSTYSTEMGLKKQKSYTDREIQLIIDNYQKMGNIELAKLIPGRSHDAIRDKLRRMGLYRTEEEINSIKDRNEGQFKKGSIPHNKKPVGTIRKRGDGYWYVKIGNRNWVLFRRMLYQQYYGTIPDGYIIRCNQCMDDLEKIDPSLFTIHSQAENIYMNYSKEAQQASLRRYRDSDKYAIDLLSRKFSMDYIKQHPEIVTGKQRRVDFL